MKHALQELRNFCACLLGEKRQRRDFEGVCDVAAIEEMRAEADAERQLCADLAFKARVADEEGIARLRAALADGHVDDTELPTLRASLRHFENSRRADHQLAEKLS